ncbi:MAG: permease-like cell division protein FtsX [Rubricoccaceae bacterium]|nr:permease-like cell division protein FtsX [Rubricoccaceae bacterium]
MPLPYSIREGIAGFNRAKFSAFMAVTALSVALVLIGFVGLLTWKGQQVAEYVRQRVGEVQVFLRPIDDQTAERLQAQLAEIPGVDSIRYVTREEAYEIFRAEFGEEADMFDAEEFLPASFQVRMNPNYATSDSLLRFQQRVQQWSRVDTVAFEQTLLVNVERNVRRYSFMGLGAGLLIVLAALLLVGNTVRLTIYARRLLIRTMKLVGATDGFIRRPFLVEGILQGLVAGIVASILVWALYAALQGIIPDLGSSGWPGGSSLVALGGLTLFGILLGWFASWIAVRRFIKKVRLS